MKEGPTCPETSATRYELAERNIAEERSHSFLDGSERFSSFGNILFEKRVLSAEEIVGDYAVITRNWMNRRGYDLRDYMKNAEINESMTHIDD